MLHHGRNAHLEGKTRLSSTDCLLFWYQLCPAKLLYSSGMISRSLCSQCELQHYMQAHLSCLVNTATTWWIKLIQLITVALHFVVTMQNLLYSEQLYRISQCSSWLCESFICLFINLLFVAQNRWKTIRLQACGLLGGMLERCFCPPALRASHVAENYGLAGFVHYSKY